jgi:hypothetical protein
LRTDHDAAGIHVARVHRPPRRWTRGVVRHRALGSHSPTSAPSGHATHHRSAARTGPRIEDDVLAPLWRHLDVVACGTPAAAAPSGAGITTVGGHPRGRERANHMRDERSPRTLLEQIIRNGDYTLDEICAEFDRMARDSDIAATLSVRQLQRWMAGEVDTARPPSRRVAVRLWGRPFDDLLGPPDLEQPNPRPAIAAAAPGGDGDASSFSWQETGTFSPQDMAATMIAHESVEHAVKVSGSADAMTIEQVQAEAWRIARRYTALPPLAVLAEARRARDLTILMLDRTRRPSQTRDLYLVAGQLCGLMAAASFDLAAWDAAAAQARAAYLYGDLIDHDGLKTWTRGYQALIAYWTGRPQDAVALAETGLANAPAGSPTVRLRGIVARAWSHLGNEAATRAAVTAADDAQDQQHGCDDLHDVIAGQFGWGPARHAACMGSALVEIGDGHAAAERIRTALSLLPDDPHGGLLAERAYCDLANAELTRRDLDAAAHALTPVWRLPAPKRSEGVTARLLKAERMLVAPRWQRARQAAEIREQIAVFNAEASARALPAPPS